MAAFYILQVNPLQSTGVAPSKTWRHVFLSIFLQLFCDWASGRLNSEEPWKPLCITESTDHLQHFRSLNKGSHNLHLTWASPPGLSLFKNLLPTVDSENENFFYFPNQKAPLTLYSLRNPCASWKRFSLVHLTLPVFYYRELKEANVHCGHFCRTSIGKVLSSWGTFSFMLVFREHISPVVLLLHNMDHHFSSFVYDLFNQPQLINCS